MNLSVGNDTARSNVLTSLFDGLAIVVGNFLVVDRCASHGAYDGMFLLAKRGEVVFGAFDLIFREPLDQIEKALRISPQGPGQFEC